MGLNSAFKVLMEQGYNPAAYLYNSTGVYIVILF
jgi:hypothetical protein